MTELCRMLIVSCSLNYDDVIRACAVSTVTADTTGKFVLLTYSLTASHCSTEAHLANKGISCQEKGDKNCSFEQGGQRDGQA